MSEELKPIEANNPGFDTTEVNAKAVAIFIVVTVVMIVAVIGGVQFYFDSVHDQEVFRARLGNLWVTGGSADGLSEEAVELAAGGVKGALLVFPAVVD
jgi:hypothetical protein